MQSYGVSYITADSEADSLCCAIVNNNKAYACYLKAAEQGNALAQFNIATLYHDGLGIPQDYKKAYDIVKPAQREGGLVVNIKGDWDEGIKIIKERRHFGLKNEAVEMQTFSGKKLEDRWDGARIDYDGLYPDLEKIVEILTVNGVRFSLEDGSWGLIRASSNKPSLVVVTESPSSDDRKKKIFEFIDGLLQKTGKIGKYDQKI